MEIAGYLGTDIFFVLLRTELFLIFSAPGFFRSFRTWLVPFLFGPGYLWYFFRPMGPHCEKLLFDRFGGARANLSIDFASLSLSLPPLVLGYGIPRSGALWPAINKSSTSPLSWGGANNSQLGLKLGHFWRTQMGRVRNYHATIGRGNKNKSTILKFKTYTN